MANPIRVIDLMHGEYIEVSSAELSKHLLEKLADLENERDEVLTQVGKYSRTVDDLLAIISDYLGERPARGDAAIVQVLLDRLTDIMKQHSRLFTYANNYATATPVMVRLSLAQARDFGY